MSGRSQPPTSANLALVAVLAALIAAFSLTPAIPTGIGVPITLQTLAVILAGLVLGPWRGFASVCLYLAVGLAGMPVFAGGSAGLAALVKPSVGYLLAFPFAALLAGFLARLGKGGYPGFFLAGLAGSVLIHAGGVIGLVALARMSWRDAFVFDLLFWPGDLVKMFLAAAIAVAVHRAFPTLLPTRPLAVQT